MGESSLRAHLLVKYLMMMVTLCIFTTTTVSAEVPPDTIIADPQPYTSSPSIERMIAKGKESVGTGKYIWGGGHRGSLMESDDFNFDQLKVDCSGFVGAILGKGLGMDLGVGLDYKGVPTTHTYFTERYEAYTKPQVKELSQAERGDIIVNNQRTHVVIYLGQDEDKRHILLDSSARGTLQSEVIGSEAEFGGVGIRYAEDGDFDIDLVLDTQKIIEEGQGTLWVSVTRDDLKNEDEFLVLTNPAVRDMSRYQPIQSDNLRGKLYENITSTHVLLIISLGSLLVLVCIKRSSDDGRKTQI